MLGGVNHVTFSCTDVETSVRFYVDVLGCRLVARWPDGAYLLAGSTWVALVHGPSESRGDGDYSHLAFDVAGHDFAGAADALRRSGAELWQDNWTEGDSLYFCDPDGRKLELHATSLAARLRSAETAPWPGLVISPEAARAAVAPPSIADVRKPRRLACAPIGVFVVVVRDDGCVLLLRRPVSDRYEVPNGAVEAEEDPSEAARRELEEEAGRIDIGDLVCFSAEKVTYDEAMPSLVSIGFACRFLAGDVVPGDDMRGSEVRWAAPHELHDIPLAVPSVDRLLAAIEALDGRPNA